MSDETFLCEVREVFSGDDLIVFVDLGVENLLKRQRIRLHGVDTPNAIKSGYQSEAGKVRTDVRTLTLRKKARLTIKSRNTSSWVVVLEVETPEGWVNVNNILIQQGYEYKPQSKAQ